MKKAIICIDDEKFILDSFKKTMKPALGKEYNIEIVENVHEFFNLLEELIKNDYQIPVVVSDYIMPLMKGDELLEKVHKKLPQTKTILLTGLATTEGVTNAVNNAGLYRYIAKPWQSEDIILTVTEAIKSYENELLLEKRRIELEIAMEKLLRLDKSKSYFVQLLAHELRTPLTSISGFSEIMMQLLTDDEIKGYCANVLHSTARLKKFSDYSLLIVELLNETYSLNWQQGMFAKELEAVIEKLNPAIAGKGINISDECKCQDVTFKYDSGLIQLVLEIIISNSIKFTDCGSSITLLDYKNEDNYIFVVKDSGVGFTKHTLDNVFKFFISDDIEYHSEGYGLGLALAKIIMDIHNGEIEVSNGSSGGAVVRLIFKI